MAKQELFNLMDQISNATIAGEMSEAGQAALEFFEKLAEIGELAETADELEVANMSIRKLFSDKICEENRTGR